MDGIKRNCLVIKTKDYRESDSLLTLLSPEGKFSAVMTGVKKGNAKLKFAAQIFFFGEFMFSKRGENFVVTGCSETESFYDIRNDIERYYAACAVLEVLNGAVPEEQEAAAPFLLALKCLSSLCYEKDISEFLILCFFLIKLFYYLGYDIKAKQSCAACGGEFGQFYFFDYDANGVVCGFCKTPFSSKISGAVWNAVKILKGVEHEGLASVKFSDEILSDVIRLLNNILNDKLGFKSKILISMLKNEAEDLL
jgi:DNA repair protein RecO (recombination protein O)